MLVLLGYKYEENYFFHAGELKNRFDMKVRHTLLIKWNELENRDTFKCKTINGEKIALRSKIISCYLKVKAKHKIKSLNKIFQKV